MTKPSGKPLFRKEIVEYRSQQEYGAVLLTRQRSSWIFCIFAAALCAAILTYLFQGTYRPRTTVSGILVPEGGTIRIAAPVGGTITERRVQEGQYVMEGEILFVVADQRKSAGGQSSIRVSDLRTNSLMARHESLLRLRASTLRLSASAENNFRAQYENLLDELERNRRELDLLGRRTFAMEKTVAQYHALAKKNYISQLELRDKQDQLAVLESQILAAERSGTQLRRAGVVLKSDLEQAPIKFAAQLAEIDRDLASLSLEVTDIQTRDTFSIVAPVTGKVTAINANIGQTASTQPLALVVPENTSLVAYLFAPSKAYGFVQVGHQVKIRYHPYPHQLFGLHGGTVVELASSPLLSDEYPVTPAMQEKGAMYRVTVRLNSQTINIYGKEINLIPGIALEADIEQAPRRLIDWIAAPIKASFDRYL